MSTTIMTKPTRSTRGMSAHHPTRTGYVLLARDRRSYRSTRPGALGGHRRSRIYGRLNCPAALRAIARGGYVRHRVFFADEATAIAAGFRPCGVCLTDQYQAWKSQNGRFNAGGAAAGTVRP